MKKVKRDLEKFTQSVPRLLFPNILDNVKFSRSKSFTPPRPIFHPDKFNTNTWNEIIKLFPELSKLTNNSINNYNDPALNTKYSIIIKYFKETITEFRYSLANNLLLSKDLMKILIIAYQHLSHTLIGYIIRNEICRYKELLRELNLLNDYLILSLDNKKDFMNLWQFDISLFHVVNDNLCTIHESLNSVKNVTLVSHLLYCHYQTLAILIAFNEGRVTSTKLIKDAFELFEKYIKELFTSQILNDIYTTPLGEMELWKSSNKTYIKIAYTLNKSKFSLIQLFFNHAKFSLRYMCLYYIWKTLQITNGDTTSSMGEQMMECLSLVLKDCSNSLITLVNKNEIRRLDDLITIELLLNETLIGLKIFQEIFLSIKSSFILLDKYGYNDFFKPLILNYFTIIIKFQLIAFPNTQEFNSSNIISYKTTQDYLSELFTFCYALSNKEIKNYQLIDNKIMHSKISALGIIEELLRKLVREIDVYKGYEIPRDYIIEYLFYNCTTFSKEIAEYIIQLIESKSINFTASNFLKTGNAIGNMTELTNKRIITLLIKIIQSDKIWSKHILKHFIELIKIHIQDEEVLFGLYKLIYCSLTSKVYDNATFFKDLHNTTGITYKMYVECVKRGGSRTIVGFNEIEGINELITILFNNLDTNNYAMNMMEKLILKIINIPLIAEHLIKQPSMIRFINNSNATNIEICFLRNLLSIARFISIETSDDFIDNTNYLPVALIDYLRKLYEDQKIVYWLPFIKLLTEFLIQESDTPSITVHQAIVNRKIDLMSLFDVLKNNEKEQCIGEAIVVFIRLLNVLQRSNNKVSEIICKMQIIHQKTLLHFIKQEIGEGMISSTEIEEILKQLIEIVYDSEFELYKSSQLLIIRYPFLIFYLSILSFLSKYPVWNNVVISHCNEFCTDIIKSYWNCSICGKYKTFKRILKLIKRNLCNVELLNVLMELCKSLISVGVSSQSFKEFIGLLNSYPENEDQYGNLLYHVLSLLVFFLSVKPSGEVFAFSGQSNSGLSLLTIKNLPKDGFCFCGSIRIEQDNQINKDATIFKLGASKQCEIELFIRDGYLHYKIEDLTLNQSPNLAIFSQRRLEAGNWYFIEFYHLNTGSDKNLRLYINCSLVETTYLNSYPYKLTYDENTIGCGVHLQYIQKQGEEKLTNNFYGQMKTLSFIEISSKTREQVHDFLLLGHNSIYDFTEQLETNKKQYEDIAEKIFMLINPKYTNKRAQSKHRVHTINKGDDKINIYNSVEQVYKDTRVNHNPIAIDTFLSIGSIKTLLPIFHNIAEYNINYELTNYVVEKLLKILELTIRISSDKLIIFFKYENGLAILKYLLEKRSIRLNDEVVNNLLVFLDAVIKFYPMIAEDCVKFLVLNPILWHCSEISVQCEVIDKFIEMAGCNDKIFNTEKMIDMLMDCIEIYVSLDPSEYRKPIDILWNVAKDYAIRNLSYNIVKKVIGYANLYYVRRLANYPFLVLMAFKMLLAMHLSCKEQFRMIIKAEFTEKRSTKFITTMLVVIVYFLHYIKRSHELTATNILIGDNKLNEEREDEIFFKYYSNQPKIIDQIIAICIYLILDLDWNDLCNPTKEYIIKSFVNVVLNSEESLESFIITQLRLMEEDKELHILRSILIPKMVTRTLGKTSFNAFISILLDKPQDFLTELGMKLKIKQSNKFFNNKLLNFILIQAIDSFNLEVTEALINLLENTHEILIELKLHKESAKLLFNISEVIQNDRLLNMQVKLLYSHIPFTKSHIWTHIKGSQMYKLKVLNHWLNLLLIQSQKFSPGNLYCNLVYLEAVYFLEWILRFDIESNAYQLLVQILVKLVIFFDRFGLLCKLTWTKLKPSEEHKCRNKGKILQVLLKAAFVCVKETESDIAYELLNYLITKDPVSKNNIMKFTEDCKGSSSDVGELEMMRKNYSSNKKITEKSCFEDKQLLSTYAFILITQLIYFELSGVNEYSKLPQKEKDIIRLPKSYRDNSFTKNYIQLIQILKSLLIKDTNNTTHKIIINNIKNLINNLQKYNIGDELFLINSEDKKFTNKLIEKFITSKNKDKTINNVFKSSNVTKSIIEIVALSKSDIDINKKVLELILNSKNFGLDDPIMLLTIVDFSKKNKIINTGNVVNSFKELVNKVWSQFSSIHLSVKKIEHDEYRNNFNLFTKPLYRRLIREQYSELGCWYNKINDKQKQALFAYVEKQYNKILNRNSNNLNKREKPYDKFMKLSLSRDKLGRAMRLKDIDPRTNYKLYSYLRSFILKKMMIRTLYSPQNIIGLYNIDFQYKLIKDLFKHVRKIPKDSIGILSNISPYKEMKCNVKWYNSGNWQSFEKCSKGRIKTYNAEMIMLKGAIFGYFVMTPNQILFCSAERLQGGEFQYGSAPQNQIKIKVYKRWKLEEITEVVTRRYNIKRQALEIYFNSSNPVFFSLYSKEIQREVIENFRMLLRKKTELKINIIDAPAKYFYDMKFTELWVRGSISNFYYLMLLNKYAGRTFNDLNQYPVFPWIIKDYKSENLSLDNSKVYRHLGVAISGINNEKRESADKRITNSSLKTDLQFQFKDHYLPYQTVIDYMIRLDPYTSVSLISKQNKNILYSVTELWRNVQNFSNSELIPEFYYLPEMFCNNNLYLLKTENGLLKSIVDDVSLPPWSVNNHLFVQNNNLALESTYASSKLEKWIDLIFGYLQQDQKRYNLFDPHCDEIDIVKFRINVTEQKLIKVQRSGVNPILLFRESHPAKLERQSKAKETIFNIYENDKNRSFILTKLITEEEQPIIFIDSFEGKLITISNAQKAYLSKERLMNSMEICIRSKSTCIELFPFKPFYDEIKKMNENCDAQRCFALLNDGEHLVTCRHYDNSLKFIKLTTGNTDSNIHFHKAMVNCICISESKDILFTASNDGVLVMWPIKNTTIDYPKWYAHNHNLTVSSIDACETLGLVATAGLDDIIVLRQIINGRLHRIIKPILKFKNILHQISHIRFSHRGYLVIITKCQSHTLNVKDHLLIYSINGEKICSKEAEDVLNGIIMSESGYEFIVGGKQGKLLKYKLLTLEVTNLLDNVIKGDSVTGEKNMLQEIISMGVMLCNGYQYLLLGTSTGDFYSLRVNS